MNLEECSMEACSGRDSSSWKSGKTSRNKKTLKLPYWIKIIILVKERVIKDTK